MQALRWRIAALSAWDGGDLAINAFHLYGAGGRIDSDAILSASHAPVLGDISAIAQSSPGAPVVFSAADVRASGFYVQWDFPSAVAVNAIRVAGGDLSTLGVFAWSAGLWVLVRDVQGLRGLSQGSLTPVLPFYVRESRAGAVACMVGESAQDGVTGVNWLLPAGAAIQEDITRGGLAMLRLQGSVSVSYPDALPAFTNWTGSDITIEAMVNCDNAPVNDIGIPYTVFCGDATANTAYWGFGPDASGRLCFYYWSGSQNHFRSRAGVVPKGRLTHIAVSIKGVTLRFFVGGKLVHTDTRVTTPTGGGNGWPLRICHMTSATAQMGSFALSDLMLTPAAKYTDDFTVAEQWDAGSQALTQIAQARIAASSEVPKFATLGHRALGACDIEFGGAGRIYGSVARKGTPQNSLLSRRVRLHRSVDGYLARETWSKADGSYEFRDINPRYEYDVIAWDHELLEFSAVANNQLAEVMS